MLNLYIYSSPEQMIVHGHINGPQDGKKSKDKNNNVIKETIYFICVLYFIESVPAKATPDT